MSCVQDDDGDIQSTEDSPHHTHYGYRSRRGRTLYNSRQNGKFGRSTSGRDREDHEDDPTGKWNTGTGICMYIYVYM